MQTKPTLLTQEVADIIVESRRQGETYSIAAKRAGIALSTLYKWKTENMEFVERLKKAEEESNTKYVQELLATTKRSLAEVIKGYEVEETKTEYENDAHGNPRIKKQIISKRFIAPSATAIMFTLTNLEPEKWKNRQTTDLNGKIESDTKADISLENVPDELLAKVIDAIKG